MYWSFGEKFSAASWAALIGQLVKIWFRSDLRNEENEEIRRNIQCHVRVHVPLLKMPVCGTILMLSLTHSCVQNMDYVVVSGASRKNERWEEREGETVSVEGHSEAHKLASDPMYRLEHGVQDKAKSDEAAPRVARIIVSSGSLPRVSAIALVPARL